MFTTRFDDVWFRIVSIFPVRCSQQIGQALLFADSVSKLGPAPDDLPACPASCPATFAPWAPATIQQLYGDSPYELPLTP